MFFTYTFIININVNVLIIFHFFSLLLLIASNIVKILTNKIKDRENKNMIDN